MRDRVLKTRSDFEKWKKEWIFFDEVIDEPREYPCLAKTFISNWDYEEEAAEYWYREDLVELLKQMDA